MDDHTIESSRENGTRQTEHDWGGGSGCCLLPSTALACCLGLHFPHLVICQLLLPGYPAIRQMRSKGKGSPKGRVSNPVDQLPFFRCHGTVHSHLLPLSLFSPLTPPGIPLTIPLFPFPLLPALTFTRRSNLQRMYAAFICPSIRSLLPWLAKKHTPKRPKRCWQTQQTESNSVRRSPRRPFSSHHHDLTCIGILRLRASSTGQLLKSR